MRNFLRALRFTWRYRRRFVFSVMFALLAAGLWSFNISLVRPCLQILTTGKSLQALLADEIREIHDTRIVPNEKKVEEVRPRLEKLEAEVPRQEREVRREVGNLAKFERALNSARTQMYYMQIAKNYADAYLPHDPFQTIALALACVVGAVFLKGVFEFGQESLVGSIVTWSQYDLRNAFLRRAIHLDVSNFNETGTTDLLTRFTNDMETLAGGIKTLLGRVIAEPLKAVACIIGACWYNWKLTVLFLILVPAALLVLTRVGHLMKRATRKLLEGMSTIYKILQETFWNIRIVKAFAREPAERLRFRQATRDYSKKAMLVVYLEAITGPIVELMGVAAVAGALLLGAFLVLSGKTEIFGIPLVDGSMDGETLIALYAFLIAISDPVRKLSSVFTRIQASFAASDRIFGQMDKEPTIQQNHDGVLLPRHHSEIEFRNVCFSYNPSKPILTGVFLHVVHGETVAIVGKNGCGKSTLLNLVPRFYDPDHGSILIDGHDIRKVNLRSLRQQVGIVTQETYLFDDTIAYNIAYGNPHATREQIELAAKQADVHEFILSLAHGYDTRVGEAAYKLSGGMKQRIGLARALLTNPSILVLDEFTSQTDTETEVRVHDFLRAYKQGRTVFVITHRLHTLEIADRIVVLDDGHVVATGSHQELMRTCIQYQRLHDAQSRRLVA